ncbi:MAG: hypothetical protein HZA17_06650 [Nitrospirae bacterium]|nr:hypothetical protein [Nitrospirota bacterium]
MKKTQKDSAEDIVFTADNAENIREALACCKNILVCGIKGVGKITNTVTAVKDNTNVYYIGNPFDYEGKRRPGSYEKYLKYILSLKNDIKIIEDIERLFKIREDIILIIDEIFGRSEAQLGQIGRLFDAENIKVVQIVGCMKTMGDLIDKCDIIIELHPDGAFTVDKELGKAICRIFGKTDKPLFDV